MNSEQEKIVKAIPMYDLMDACCALHGGMELDKIEDKNYALKHSLNRLFGYLTPEAKACLLYTSPSPRDVEESRMPSSA